MKAEYFTFHINGKLFKLWEYFHMEATKLEWLIVNNGLSKLILYYGFLNMN